MTIGKRLAAIGALLVGLTAVLGTVTLVGLARYDKIVHSIADDALAGVSACSKMESDVLMMQSDMWRHMSSNNSQDMALGEQEIGRIKSRFSQTLQEVRVAIFADEERELNQKIQPALDAFYLGWDKVLPLSRAGKNTEAFQLYTTEVSPLFTNALHAIQAETEYNRKNGSAYAAQAGATYSSVKWLTWFVLLASSIGGGVVFFFVARSLNRTLVRSVSSLSEGASQVASAEESASASEELSSQAEAMSEVVRSLRSLLESHWSLHIRPAISYRRHTSRGARRQMRTLFSAIVGRVVCDACRDFPARVGWQERLRQGCSLIAGKVAEGPAPSAL